MGFEFSRGFNDDPTENDINKLVMDYVQQFCLTHPEAVAYAIKMWDIKPSQEIIDGFKIGMWLALREVTLGHMKIVIAKIDKDESEKKGG